MMNIQRPKIWKSELYPNKNQFCANLRDSSLTPTCTCGRDMKCVDYTEEPTQIVKFWRCITCESVKEIFYQIYIKDAILNNDKNF